MLNSSVFFTNFALLAVSTAQATTNGWGQVNVTDATNEMLYAALRNTITYSPNMTTFACVFSTYTLETQVVSPSTSNYNFFIEGCVLESAEYVGQCPTDAFMCANSLNMNVFVQSEPRTDTLKVTSIVTKADPELDFNDL
ncbi:hypothetical protein PHMEG_00041742 [Phytophthora megakarya]|uniref:Uncharacterized protein n=1 Tax=Phytophthora megakarya TaxID=4795 RepID=A0A225UB62_9STRA|nr:hypothetical protein PHMEG_00041742 [Phytophthora megakarya]